MEIAIPYIIDVCKGIDFQRYLKNIANFVISSFLTNIYKNEKL